MTTERIPSSLTSRLNLVVFERAGEDRFRLIGEWPAWLPRPDFSPSGDLDLSEAYPLLSMFLPECEALWGKADAEPQVSDIWTETSPVGEEVFVQAVAACANGADYVTLRPLPQELYTYQQLAHDIELRDEETVRLNKELARARDRAEQATQAKSTFLASMSHEIRTPLNAIIGMADVLTGTTLSADQKKCVAMFQRNAISLLNLINDILDLAKVESGKIELESARMNVREVIAGAIEVVQFRAQAKGLATNARVDERVPQFLMGDPTRLRQVIINLLGNGLKFTERGGLEVRLEPDPNDDRPGRWRFAVVDTGIGIPADRVDAVFESFTQVDSSTTRKYGGTGLGLTISKQLVELMDGRIWIESEVGKGSTFFFSAGLPVAEDQSLAEAPEEAKATGEGQLAGLRILLADDSDDNRFLIHSYLRAALCSLEDAENGEIALQKFQSGSYEIVLMDCEMPVMDGYTATREIRKWERDTARSATPIVALTAHAFAEIATRTADAGFTAHLTKPIRKATLLSELARYCNRLGAAPAEVQPETACGEVARLRVRVDPDLADVVPGYLDKRRRDIPQYRQALQGGDFQTVRMLGHKMRGTGAGYGFDQLTALGKSIEEAALAADSAAAAAAVDQVERYLAAVELDYVQ
jgi:signal transduction histidine kinase/DNA-binding response OmpR family regulator